VHAEKYDECSKEHISLNHHNIQNLNLVLIPSAVFQLKHNYGSICLSAIGL